MTDGGVPAPAERLAPRDGQVASRGSHARETIENQQHVQAAGAQRGGLRKRGLGRAEPLGGRTIAGRTDDRRARTDRAQPALRFAAAFANQRNDGRVGAAAGNDRFEQRGLTGARTAEDSNARTAAEDERTVERADPGPERRRDRDPLARRRHAQRARTLLSPRRGTVVEHVGQLRAQDAHFARQLDNVGRRFG